jgi:hypothetical protein
VVVRLVFVHWHGGVHWGSYPHPWLGRTPDSGRNPIPLSRKSCHGLFILSKFLGIRMLTVSERMNVKCCWMTAGGPSQRLYEHLGVKLAQI